LSNLLSGNSAESGARIPALQLDVGFRVESPFLVDFDQHGAEEAQRCVFAGNTSKIAG